MKCKYKKLYEARISGGKEKWQGSNLWFLLTVTCLGIKPQSAEWDLISLGMTVLTAVFVMRSDTAVMTALRVPEEISHPFFQSDNFTINKAQFREWGSAGLGWVSVEQAWVCLCCTLSVPEDKTVVPSRHDYATFGDVYVCWGVILHQMNKSFQNWCGAETSKLALDTHIKDLGLVLCMISLFPDKGKVLMAQ